MTKASPRIYDIPDGTPFRRCRECSTLIGFVTNPDTGKSVPVTADGISHFLTCSNPKRFSKGKAA